MIFPCTNYKGILKTEFLFHLVIFVKSYIDTLYRCTGSLTPVVTVAII